MKIEHMLKNAAAILLVALPTIASAQQLGTYNGTTADGNPVSFTVGYDTVNSVYEITSASIQFSATCAATGDIINEGWGFGVAEDIIAGRAPFQAESEYFDIYAPAGVAFHGTMTVTGHLISRTAVFKTDGQPAGGAQFCMSPNQAFTATFASPERVPALPLGTEIHVGRPNGTNLQGGTAGGR
ncbi:MAG TPA: hypothetical protein VNX86_11600 [Rhizomicrobium sp.]|jgi:hypothetical protein|nr:hypothetical protein [Rhizomicrobium sp.]